MAGSAPCPKCGHLESQTRTTSLRTGGVRWRYRECLNCKHKFVTVEVPREEYKKLVVYRRIYQHLQSVFNLSVIDVDKLLREEDRPLFGYKGGRRRKPRVIG